MTEHILPHDPIIDDMVGDVLSRVADLNRRVGRAVERHGTRVHELALQVQSGQTLRFFKGPAQPELPFDDHEASMQKKVEVMADQVGEYTLRQLCTSASFTLGVEFYDARRLRVPNLDARVSMRDFTTGIWAPDYAARFTEAAVAIHQSQEAIK